jgi:hypothetical protein
MRRSRSGSRRINSSPSSTRNNSSSSNNSSSNNNNNSSSCRLEHCSSNQSSRSNIRFACGENGDNDNGNGEDPVGAAPSEHNRSFGFSSGIGSQRSRISLRRNRIYQFDDISSLYFDEYGYDRKLKKEELEDDDDSVSEFFKAPSKEELSSELFRLVEPNTSVSDALKCLGKLRMWGMIADTDPTTTKYLVEFQAVPTLLYFVRGVIEKRRSLKLAYFEQLQARQGQHIHKNSSNNNNAYSIEGDNSNNNNNNNNTGNNNEIGNHHKEFVDATNNNELCLHQAMQVIHHYTCFSEAGSHTTKKKSLKSLVLKKAVLAQLVEIDGVDLLVGLLEEQLLDLVGRKDSLTAATAIDQYGHSVSKSIWLVLMNVGACDHAIQLIKNKRGHRNHSKARRLLSGIVIGLNHRFRVSGSKDPGRGPIMPEGALNTSSYSGTDRDEHSPCDADDSGDYSASSWMEDLFVTLCRLVASKEAEDVEEYHGGKENHYSTRQQQPLLRRNEHDEIRTMVIDLCVVKKCLQALIDEPNTVLGQDPFVTTLAMSFFYACVRFAHSRYKIIKEEDHRKKQRQLQDSVKTRSNKIASIQSQRRASEKMVSTSLDFDRLVEFILRSVKSFPSHHLIQGTGCLLLESIANFHNSQSWWDQQSSASSIANHCCGAPLHPGKRFCSEKGILSDPIGVGLESFLHKNPGVVSYVSDIVEPCRWYCPNA